jgi:hypothetical protein
VQAARHPSPRIINNVRPLQMHFLSLLGRCLKDDDVVDVLERNEIDVVYDFDRSHENIDDIYWAPSINGGFVLKFGAKQVLETIFLYAAPIEGFTAIDRTDCDVTFFSSVKEVEAYAIKSKARFNKGVVDLLGIHREWVRLEYDGFSVHTNSAESPSPL